MKDYHFGVTKFYFCFANAHQIAKIRCHCDRNNNFIHVLMKFVLDVGSFFKNCLIQALLISVTLAGLSPRLHIHGY